MASVTFAVNPELKAEISKFNWVNWSALAREEISRRQKIGSLLLKKLNSKEEQELTRWSVELGRRAKKDSFKRLLSKVSPKIREELLAVMKSKSSG